MGVQSFFRKEPAMKVAIQGDRGAFSHQMADGLRDTAAIASRQAARESGARILMTGLEDDKKNFTRFFLIQKGKKIASGADKTSLVFSLKNVPGALFKALSVFAL